MTRLDRLDSEACAVIARITAPSPLKERLLSLGFVRHTPIMIAQRSFLGGTIVVKVGNHDYFSLRRSEAACILVEDHDF